MHAPRLNATRKKRYLYHEQVIRALLGKERAYAAAYTRAAARGVALQKETAEMDVVIKTDALHLSELQQLERYRLRPACSLLKTTQDLAKIQQRLTTVFTDAEASSCQARRAQRKMKADGLCPDRLRGHFELLEASERARREFILAASREVQYGLIRHKHAMSGSARVTGVLLAAAARPPAFECSTGERMLEYGGGVGSGGGYREGEVDIRAAATVDRDEDAAQSVDARHRGRRVRLAPGVAEGALAAGARAHASHGG